MLKSFVRTLRGPSRDPRMAHISRPLPRNLLDEQVLEALEIAFAENPDPAYLVETLTPALRKVTGHDYEVLDRTAADVTGSFVKTSVMIRDGSVGLWPGYAARAYPLLARDARTDRRCESSAIDLPEEARAAIAAGAPGGDASNRKPGWDPPPLPGRVTEPAASSDAEQAAKAFD